jgi:hypothetical protein
MPLLDHIRPPVNQWLPWSSLHSGMLTELAAGLNARLPSGFIALDSVRFGPAAENDVATYDDLAPSNHSPAKGHTSPPADPTMSFEYPAAPNCGCTSATGRTPWSGRSH